MAARFAGPTTGKQANQLSMGGQSVFREKLVAGQPRPNRSRERMTYICCTDAALPEPGLFEREQAEEFVNKPADRFHTVFTPRPHLRSDQVEDGYAQSFQMSRQPQMEIGTVGEKRRDRPVLPHEANKSSILAVYSRQMERNLRQAYNGQL